MQNKKSTIWNMRATKADEKNRAMLVKRLGVKSEAEAVRRAVAMALQITNPQRDQSNTMQTA